MNGDKLRIKEFELIEEKDDERKIQLMAKVELLEGKIELMQADMQKNEERKE